jgi:predicted dehydrogenase
VPALKGVSEAELYAVCTAHADTAQAAADKFGVTRAYGNDKKKIRKRLGSGLAS